ncbi:MAG: ferritin-like domain-containing protein [Chlamydiales bacterium]|nr:ferritin-like domain-containing protein [Chlamydiales bacterium]
MRTATFQGLFVDVLRDLYDAEHQTLKGLVQMIKHAHDPDLKEAFQNHHKETRNQIARLEHIFEDLDQDPEGMTCHGMEGLMEEAKEVLKQRGRSAIKDAALIIAAQKIEHYEMAAYGSARTIAAELDLDDIADLLQDSLNEEGGADKKLTKLAKGGLFSKGINEEAEEYNDY